MPNIDPQHKRILPTPLRRTQYSHSHNVVEPIVISIPSLEHNAKLQTARRLRWSRSLQQNIRAVVRAEVVAGVGAEDACLGIGDSPVSAEVEDLACFTLVAVVIIAILAKQGSGKEADSPLILGPVTLPPRIGMAVRMPRGPSGPVYSLFWHSTRLV
jgi:hypothetical protein